MHTISIQRNKGGYGMMRGLKIYADDKAIGIVKLGETTSVEIPNGASEIYCKMDWAKTNKMAVSELVQGDVLEVNARFTINPLLLLGITGLPIKLEKPIASSFT